jgi:phospholipid/cholesterol/gamma-HCH transport system substrate-binding protein
MSPRPRPRAATKRRGPRLHPLAIAALVIFVTVFVVYYAFNEGLPFESEFTLYAVVDNSVNVNGSTPVRVAGVDVGNVTSVSADGQYSKIGFTVDSSSPPVHKDATVVIRDRLFLEGSYYLDLDPGTPSAPIARSGFTIEPQNTDSPVQAYKLLSLFTAPVRSDLKNTINTLNQGFSQPPGQAFSASGAAALARALPPLVPVLGDLAQVSRALGGTEAGDVQRLLGSAARLTTTLNNSGARLTGLVDELDSVASALVSHDGALSQSVARLDDVVRAAPSSLSALDGSLPALGQLARALTPALRASPPILDRLNSTARQLVGVISPSARGPLLVALRTTLESFPHALTLLGRAFPATSSVGECLVTHVLPILRQEVPDGALSSGNPVWKDFVHFLPGVAGATGDFDGNGYYTRVLAGFGASSLAGGSATTLSNGLEGLLPGGGTLSGISPHWIGDLTAADFHPEAPCAAQRLPSLGVVGSTAPDLVAARRGASGGGVGAGYPSTRNRLRRALRAALTGIARGKR